MILFLNYATRYYKIHWIEIENNPEDESAGKRMVPFNGELWIEAEDFREEADNKNLESVSEDLNKINEAH